MPRSDYTRGSADHSERSAPAAALPSRRALLRTAAGTGAAGLAAGTGLTAWGARAQAARRPSRAHGAGSQDAAIAAAPVVVHVRDPRTGEMDIFAGTSQTRLRDRALAALLAQAAARPGTRH
jgi:hypothetical protein